MTKRAEAFEPEEVASIWMLLTFAPVVKNYLLATKQMNEECINEETGIRMFPPEDLLERLKEDFRPSIFDLLEEDE